MSRLAAKEVGKLDPYKFMAVIGVARRPANIRKMAWLMPRMARAVPYLGYLVVSATKPA